MEEGIALALLLLFLVYLGYIFCGAYGVRRGLLQLLSYFILMFSFVAACGTVLLLFGRQPVWALVCGAVAACAFAFVNTYASGGRGPSNPDQWDGAD